MTLSPCRVNIVASPDEQAVAISDAANPAHLLYLEEGGRGRPVLYRASRFIRARRPVVIDVRLNGPISYAQRREIVRSVIRLIRKTMGRGR